MEMDYNVPFYIRNVILCIGFLVGVCAGIYLIIRKHILAGILAIIGFTLFALEPIADIIIYRILFTYELEEQMYSSLDWAYACTSTVAFFIGSVALMIALVSEARDRHKSPQGELQAPEMDGKVE